MDIFSDWGLELARLGSWAAVVFRGYDSLGKQAQTASGLIGSQILQAASWDSFDRWSMIMMGRMQLHPARSIHAKRTSTLLGGANRLVESHSG